MPLPNEKSAAYLNLQEVRKYIRYLYESIDKSSSMSNYSACKSVVDAHAHKSPTLQQAIQQERAAAAALSDGSGGLNATQRLYVTEAYRLIQKVPSFADAPEGEIENKLRAIEALVKAKGGTAYIGDSSPVLKAKLLDSIVSILDPGVIKKKIEADKLKVEQEHAALLAKQKEKAAQWPPVQKLEDLSVLEMDPSNWHLQPVASHDTQWPGKKMSLHYAMKNLPANAPITWGACAIWVDKGVATWDKKPPVVFAHPGWYELWKKTGFTGPGQGSAAIPLQATE